MFPAYYVHSVHHERGNRLLRQRDVLATQRDVGGMHLVCCWHLWRWFCYCLHRVRSGYFFHSSRSQSMHKLCSRNHLSDRLHIMCHSCCCWSVFLNLSKYYCRMPQRILLYWRGRSSAGVHGMWEWILYIVQLHCFGQRCLHSVRDLQHWPVRCVTVHIHSQHHLRPMSCRQFLLGIHRHSVQF